MFEWIKKHKQLHNAINALKLKANVNKSLTELIKYVCRYVARPVPDWILDECGGFSILNKKTPKKNFKMTCPRCGKETMQYKNDNE